MSRKALVVCVAAALVSMMAVIANAASVPPGTENIVIDSMCKAKEAAGKKVLKGPVPLNHQGHMDTGMTCKDCHHETAEGEQPKPCGECHKDKDDKQVIKLDSAFHGGENDNQPSLHSCIGCHRRTVKEKKPMTSAPWEKKPCEACHSILKKK